MGCSPEVQGNEAQPYFHASVEWTHHAMEGHNSAAASWCFFGSQAFERPFPGSGALPDFSQVLILMAGWIWLVGSDWLDLTGWLCSTGSVSKIWRIDSWILAAGYHWWLWYFSSPGPVTPWKLRADVTSRLALAHELVLVQSFCNHTEARQWCHINAACTPHFTLKTYIFCLTWSCLFESLKIWIEMRSVFLLRIGGCLTEDVNVEDL